ncbi:MAG: DUF1800 domain-containing protein [Gammaproteobacteria bacterium]|nr:DUF1800 domain-containing protein [Gammaproteobacteria bacterium]
MGQTAAARLLTQATFGPTIDGISSAAAESYDAWFSAQAAAAPSLNLPSAMANAANVNWTPTWFDNVVKGPDQLRQRMAFALSQILVVSGNGGPLWGHNRALAYYYDLLVQNALGNYRTLLQQVTLSPAMGEFLSMMRNDKSDPATNRHADQNYGREVMQLFTVGLVKLNLDGTVQTDANGNPIPTYTQDDVANLSNVFTGWASKPVSHTGEGAWLYDLDETDPMVAYENHHDTTQKTIIGGVVIPAGGTAESDLSLSLDTLFNNPNVGPFISKQLIQHLVTSNPSPAYVQRVATVFNNDGKGVRGNLLAVAKAILTDPEATSPATTNYGKLREPLLRLTDLWRAFDAYNSQNRLNEYGILLNGTQYFGELPLAAPSVFNFFRPDYQPPGALTQANLQVPEFQITNENTLVLTANQLQQQSYQFVDGTGAVHMGPDYNMNGSVASTSVMLHTAAWEQYAANPASLVDELNLVLMAGQMPAAMRSALITYATAVPATSPGSRVAETAELILNSPQYAIQR